MLAVGTTAAQAIGVIEVGQTQAMAELVADGADAGNIVVIDIVLILFASHIGRAGIEPEVHAVEHGRIGEILHVGPQVVTVIGSDIRAVAGNHEEHHVGSAILIGIILAEVHIRVQRLEGGKENGIAFELMSVGASVGDIHRTQDVEMRVKLLERVVIVVITHAAHCIDLGAIGQGVALVVLAVDHGLIEVNRRVVAGNVLIKVPVGVVDQDDQAAELAVVHVATVTDAAQQVVALVQHLLTLLNHSLAFQTLGHASEVGAVGSGAVIACNSVAGDKAVTVESGIGVIAGFVLDNGVTIGGCQVVKELIAMQNDCESGAVGLRHRGGRGVCRNCQRVQTHQSHHK